MICHELKGLVYPIELKYDVEKLIDSYFELCKKICLSRDQIKYELDHYKISTFNLTHLPSLSGEDRWKKHRGGHFDVLRAGVKEGNFTESLKELDGSYIKEYIEEIKKYHYDKFNSEFIGRIQIISSSPGHTYPFHRDAHTKHRYHVPIITDENFFFLMKEENQIHTIHLPADGRCWYLNPVDITHTVAHLGKTPRTHILLTSEM